LFRMSVFPAVFLARATTELLEENSQKVVPPLLMPSCFVRVRKVGMHQGHQSIFSLLLEGHSNHRFFSQGIWRHPGMLHSIRPVKFRESAVMGRPSQTPVEESVQLRIQQKPFGCMPGITG